jgi:hypothetical protein
MKRAVLCVLNERLPLTVPVIVKERVGIAIKVLAKK